MKHSGEKMALEVERKFHVPDAAFLAGLAGKQLRQVYLAQGSLTVRVRIVDDARALLTLKGAPAGITRAEFEYVIPLQDALDMAACEGALELSKTRYLVEYSGNAWEVDVYGGVLAGLCTAEIEASSEAAAMAVALPSWLGREVTGVRAWDNDQLAEHGRPCTT
jgi:adenylate cyclase